MKLAQVRILPLICGIAAVLFCLKVADVVGVIGASSVAVTDAQAASKEKEKDKEKDKDKDSPVTPPVALRPAEPRPSPVPQSDTEMLQVLAQRRAELDRRTEEMQQREVLLKATEQRIEEKVAKLQAMEKAIGEGVKKRDEEDEQRLKSLVKIYETMKPKEAARVFEQLDLPVLLGVLSRMKEQKSAPILASMDPAKAKAVTTALAEKLPTPKFN